MAYAVIRSRVGTYHIGYGPSSFCGVRKCSLASKDSADRASESMFCEKCFPNGKPAEFVEAVDYGQKITTVAAAAR